MGGGWGLVGGGWRENDILLDADACNSHPRKGEGVQTQIHKYKYKYNQVWAGDRDLEKMLLEIRIKQISSQSTIRGWQEVEQLWVEFSFSTVRVSTEWRRKSVDLCFMSFMHRGGEDWGNFSPDSIHWMRPVLGFWGNEWSIRTAYNRVISRVNFIPSLNSKPNYQ